MRVSSRDIRHIKPVFAGFSAVAMAALLFWSPGAHGGEGCCTHKKTHDIRVPGISVAGPNVSVSTPGVFVNKGGISVNNNFVSGGGFFVGGGGASGQTFISGGGGGGFIGGSTPTVISNLNVESDAAATVQQVAVPYTETITKMRWVEDVYVLRAVCMDGKGMPHPASRPNPDVQVPAAYEGELFRCMAGTSMQVTLGKYVDGHGRFDHGSTIICAKGEALRYAPGGRVRCMTQEPRRNCNERSLLRKFGPGEKVLRLRHQQQYTEQVTRTRYETRATSSASAKASAKTTLVLSGGVGGGAPY